MKIKSIIRYVLIISVLLNMMGCGEKTNCSAYPEKYMRWIPFQKGDQYSFTDGTNTIQINVNEVYRTEAYIEKQSWPMDKMCTSEAYAKMTSNSFLSNMEFTSSLPEPLPDNSLNRDTASVYFRIVLLSDEWSEFGFSIRDGQFANTIFFSTPIPLLSSFNNGYREYSNVLKLEHDTLINKEAIYQVYVAESAGIIQFKDRKKHKTWSLINK